MRSNIFSLIISKKTFLLYFAAILSFISVLSRDIFLVKFTSHSVYIFSFFYISSLFSSFPINAIILNKKFSRFRPHLFTIFLALIIFFVSYLTGIIPINVSVISLIIVIILWISGAALSRNIMDLNYNFILARSRETIATLLLPCLLVMGVRINVSISLSCLISFLILVVYLISKDQSFFKNWISSDENITFFSKDFLRVLFLSNLAVSLMTFWALHKTNQHTIVFSGIYSEVLARFSMYLFQGLTIFSVMFTLDNISGKYPKKLFLFLAIFFSFFYFLFSGLTEYVSLPLALVFFHYYIVLSLK
jgi:hypothetical protein